VEDKGHIARQALFVVYFGSPLLFAGPPENTQLVVTGAWWKWRFSAKHPGTWWIDTLGGGIIIELQLDGHC